MIKRLSDEELSSTVKRIGELHGNMAVLSKLDTLLKNTDSDVMEPVRLIQSDGAISASIIHIANSPLYGFADKSENISDALQTVGYSQALKLVSIALSRQVFMRDLVSYGVSADSYWRYSFFTASFLERHAKRIGIEPDDAYLLGLLHSIGRVVINELLLDEQVEVFWDRFIPEQSWERMTVGFTNHRAGSTLLRLWGFPEGIFKRVALQNNPDAVLKDPLLSLLDYSRSIALNLIDPKRLASLLKSGAHPIQQRLNLETSALIQEVSRIENHVDEVYSSLKNQQ